ncbi:MAG: PilZ domain-containing protein [Deltaproteobacteria bacterium]|nr:PilZ domain-containing protein [Deltaproteobacteria bacterium]
METPLSPLETTQELPCERRDGSRVALLRPVQYCVGKKLLIGEILDIGEDGMRLRATRPVGVGTTLTLYLSLPASGEQESRMCVLDARVVWEQGTIAGLAFAEGPNSTRECMSLLLARQLQALVR